MMPFLMSGSHFAIDVISSQLDDLQINDKYWRKSFLQHNSAQLHFHSELKFLWPRKTGVRGGDGTTDFVLDRGTGSCCLLLHNVFSIIRTGPCHVE